MNVQIMEEVTPLPKDENLQVEMEDEDSAVSESEEADKVNRLPVKRGKLESNASIAKRLGMHESKVRRLLKKVKDGRLNQVNPVGRPIKKKAWTAEAIAHATGHETLKNQFSLSLAERTQALNQTFGIEKGEELK